MQVTSSYNLISDMHKGGGNEGEWKRGGLNRYMDHMAMAIPSASRLDDDSEPNDVTILNSVYEWYVSLVPCTLNNRRR